MVIITYKLNFLQSQTDMLAKLHTHVKHIKMLYRLLIAAKQQCCYCNGSA